jgi:integrase
MRLNETAVKNLEPASRKAMAKVYYDDEMPGFGARISYMGTVSFVLNYTTHAGRERRVTIGKHPFWSVAAARERAKELRRMIDRGGDPLAEKQEARGALTFGELVAEYEERHTTKSGRKLKGGHRDLDILNREAISEWKHRAAIEITRAEVRKLCETKAATAPSAGNKLLDVIKRLYNFGIRRDLLEVNPARGIERPGVETPKDRALSESEIKTLWEGLDGARSVAADVLRMILLTAARPGEVCGLPWAELDLDTGIWSLPAARAKNGLAHRVPLTKTALEIIERQPKTSRYVFRGQRKGSALHTSRPSRLLAEHEYFGIKNHYTPHDLRRTAASHMARIGIPRLVVKKILNHSERGDTTAIYERHGYDAEKRDALQKWERELLRILGKAKSADVVEIAS